MTDKIRKIMGAGLFALVFSLVCGSNVRAQSCLTPPSCDTLGYKQSASDCSGQERVLKCPFDQTKMFCLGSGAGEVPNNVAVGAILYADKTVTTSVISGKTPIGIVFDSDLRLAVALHESANTMQWGGYGKDIPALDNCDASTGTVYCGIDGKTNTAAILAYGKANNISYPAAEYCNKYAVAGTKAGDWHLPSLYELKNIYDNKAKINATISKIGTGTPLDSKLYWSSTEYYDGSSWSLDMGNGNNNLYTKRLNSYVRMVLAF